MISKYFNKKVDDATSLIRLRLTALEEQVAAILKEIKKIRQEVEK